HRRRTTHCSAVRARGDTDLDVARGAPEPLEVRLGPGDAGRPPGRVERQAKGDTTDVLFGHLTVLVWASEPPVRSSAGSIERSLPQPPSLLSEPRWRDRWLSGGVDGEW